MTRFATRLVPVLSAVLAVGLLAGCSTPRRHIPGTAPLNAVNAATGGLPTDLPRDPGQGLTYCRVWVPPVYRDVPTLETVPGHMVTETHAAMKTTFFERQVQPKGEYWLEKQPCDCDMTAVEVAPGGWKWAQVNGDCWQYCYTPPQYSWRAKQVKDERITYANEVPAQYETVARSCPTTVTQQKYVPGGYRVVWKRECYRPGQYVWQAREGGCAPCATDPGTSKTTLVPARTVGGAQPAAGVTGSCPRCN